MNLSLRLALVSVLYAAPAAGATTVHGKPCAGCIASIPDGPDAAPLAVVLHGDGETPDGVFQGWAGPAAHRGIAVLAPACPAKEGCTAHSWWKWDGDPAWLAQQVDAFAQLHAVDRARLWLVGWSGGGTYIGWRTQELERTFAAFVVHGGGYPPASPECGDARVGVYFLVGDGNPLHAHVVTLRDYYVACRHDVTWDLLPKADHGGERRALASHVERVLDWLQAKGVRAPAVADAGGDDAAAGVANTAAPVAPDPPSDAGPAVIPAVLQTPPRGACACAGAGVGVGEGASAGAGAWAVILVVLARAVLRLVRPGSPRGHLAAFR